MKLTRAPDHQKAAEHPREVSSCAKLAEHSYWLNLLAPDRNIHYC